MRAPAVTSKTVANICVVLLIAFCTNPVFGQVTGKQAARAATSASERMGGEDVLSTKTASLLSPLCRQEGHPWFELVNVRPGKNLEIAIEMDFAMEGKIDRPLYLVVITSGRIVRFPLDKAKINKRRGVIACTYESIGDKSPLGANVEAYVELMDAASKSTGIPITSLTKPTSYRYRSGTPNSEIDDVLYFKVSKSATRGDVATPTLSREMRPSERRIFEARQKKYGPPPPPPEGFTAATVRSPLVPGTPVRSPYEGDWLEAEILAVRKSTYSSPSISTVVVHWPALGNSHNKAVAPGLVALKPEVLAQLNSDPKEFSPSMELAAGSLQPPPEGYVVLPDDLALVLGVPVCVGNSTSMTYTVTASSPKQVTVALDRHPSHRQTYNRNYLVIHKDDVARLESSKQLEESKEEYAKRWQSVLDNDPFKKSRERSAAMRAQFEARRSQGKAGSSPTFKSPSVRRYPISIALPIDHVRVEADTPLKAGMALQVSYFRKWELVTVVSVPESGGVGINWPGWGNYLVSRDSLVISKKALAEMKSNADADSSPKTKPKGKDDKSDGNPKDHYRLRLDSAEKSRFPVARVIMKLTEIGLKDALEATDNSPIVLETGLTKSKAEEMKKTLESAGAKVSLELIKKSSDE